MCRLEHRADQVSNLFKSVMDELKIGAGNPHQYMYNKSDPCYLNWRSSMQDWNFKRVGCT